MQWLIFVNSRRLQGVYIKSYGEFADFPSRFLRPRRLMSANSSHWMHQHIGVRRCVANRAATGRRFARIRRSFAVVNVFLPRFAPQGRRVRQAHPAPAT